MRHTTFPTALRAPLALGAIALSACDGDTSFNPPDPDSFVVQAFLFTDEPVVGITVTGVLAIDADSTAVPDPISDADLVLYRNGAPFPLVPTDTLPGSYHYDGDDLPVRVGDEFRLEARWRDQFATATTVVPDPPVGLGLSTDAIEAPTFDGGGGFGGGGGFAIESVVARWDNAASQLYFVVIDNLEADPEILPTTEIFSRFAPRLIQQPTAADSSLVNPFVLTHFGEHRLKLYRVNDEYADLYEGLEQDSRDLNEPPSNIDGALGVFSAFAADSAFFRVY